MQKIICFVLMLTISVATDVDVYVYNGYEFNGKRDQPVANPVPSSIFIFDYHSGDLLSMEIYLRNEAVNVTTDVFLNYTSDVHTQKKTIEMDSDTKRRKFYRIRRVLNDSEIFIGIELSTTTGLCTRKQIVKGKVVTGSPDEINDTSYNNICLKDQYCVIEVDLLNVFEGNTDRSVPSQNDMIMYVVPSVIVMCVILLVIYTTVKKYCHRNPHPVETIELNTYSTAKEVVYADLSLVDGDSQPARRDEESPYAEIIGVLNPH